jgi:hypothetical protein
VSWGRDVFWSLAICAALNFIYHYRPLWSARSFVEEQAAEGFEGAYAGYRYAFGDDLVAPGGRGLDDRMRPRIRARRVNIRASEMSWSGDRAEFVVQYRLALEDGSPDGEDISEDMHVVLQRERGRWRYGHFETRELGPDADPNRGNPWERALRAGREARDSL